MKKKFGRRGLSLLLALVTVFGLLNMTGLPSASAATEYATPATETELNDVPLWFSADSGANGVAAYVKLINGKAYVWGTNTNYVLGIKEYTDSNGNLQTVSAGTVVPVPTQIPQTYFNNEKVVRIYMTYQCCMALTDENNLYVWGGQVATNVLGLSTAAAGATPIKVDTTAIGNNKIVNFSHTGFMYYIQVRNGSWYTFGYQSDSGGYGLLQMGDNTGTISKPTLVPASMYTSLGESTLTGETRTVKTIVGQYTSNTMVLTDDGKLFGFGRHYSTHSLGVGSAAAYYTETPANLEDKVTALKGVTFTYLTSEDQAYAAIDSEGNVWAMGTNNSNRFGSSALMTAAIVFNHDVYQKKAVRAWVSYNRLVILCDDNTVYAMGANTNNLISLSSSDTVSTPTQILSEVSESATIVGVYSSNKGIMAITKAGDMYFAGDNTSGGAGNGTTTNAAAGATIMVTSEAMPPSEPLTNNEVLFELELTENKKTVTYRPMTDADGNAVYDSSGQMLYNKTVAGTTTSDETLTVDAGTTFKLNVYFNDFGKINAFILPIRYNPSLVKVVNGSGTAYSDTVDYVSPGAVGSSVGIEQCFTIKDWPSGSLVAGVYPKISNADGWVSVSGISYDSNPSIDSEVKMFSINFRAQTTSSEIEFDIATPDNVTKGTDGSDQATVGNGYDATAVNSSNGYGAWWMIYNATSDSGATGYFEFNFEPFPAFSSRLVALKALDMTLTYGDNDTKVDLSGDGELTAARQPGWTINWSNTSVVYTVTANPYSDDNKTTPGASFPQVNWSLSLDNTTTENSNNGDRTLEDYISVLYQGDTYMQFTVNPNFTPIDDEDPGFIKITATSKVYPSINTAYTLKLRSYEAPNGISIVQGSDTSYTDVSEVIYHYTNSNDENKTFHALVTDKSGNVAENNTEVVWSLLDSEGNTITSGDTSAAVVFGTVIAGDVTVLPKYTTGDDEYVTLRVESLYDANVYDEVKIKVQLYATQLSFSVDTIRMAVEADGVPSSVDLSKYLQVTPVDVYATDYSWAITCTPTADPANATDVDPGFVAGSSVNWGSLGSGSDASVFNAFEWATPTAKTTTDGIEQYVTVTVTDSYSEQTASIKIAILDLNSPIGINQFTATNNLGYTSDTLLVKSGLEVGMKLQFYPTYEDALKKDNPYSTTTIVDGMTPYFQFTVGNKDGSLYGGAGGFIGVIVIGKDTEGNEIYYDPVPVPYDAEPSLVDGYIHLYGKESGSIADEGIRIDMEGPDFKETVYTNKTGYFKFTKYIAPGSYTMTISRANYLTRVVGMNITQTEDGEFHISTSLLPISIFPGELTGDNAITVADISLYATNWYGLYDNNIANFDSYDFVEDGSITMEDLALVMMRKDWISGSYAKWSTATK